MLWGIMNSRNAQKSASTALDPTKSEARRQQPTGTQCDPVAGTTIESHVIEETTPRSMVAQEQKLCVICLDKERDMVLTPCFHLCVCTECSVPLTSCPLCRNVIVTKNKVYC